MFKWESTFIDDVYLDKNKHLKGRTVAEVAKEQGKQPIDLELAQGEFFAVVGPSGCGKSTLLEIIAGLSQASEGTYEFEGRTIRDEIPDGVGVVFQEDSSFPWLTVEDNIGFGLRKKKLGDDEDFKRRLTYARNKLLMERYLQTEGKAAVSDAALHDLYQQVIKEMAGEQEVHARHILFRVMNPTDAAASKAAEAKVKAVIDRVKKGEDFNKLANELTEDPSGKDNGGDLGYFTKEQMVP